MGSWIKNNPVSYAVINLALCVFLLGFGFKVYVDNRINKRIDKRIIEEYQHPIVGKLDTLINLYSNERRGEVGDTTVIY